MELLRHTPVGFLDCAVIGVGRDSEDFVIVFCFGALEEGVGFLKEGLDLWGGGVVFFCVIKGLN